MCRRDLKLCRNTFVTSRPNTMILSSGDICNHIGRIEVNIRMVVIETVGELP